MSPCPLKGFDKYIPRIWDFTGGMVATVLAAMLSMMPGLNEAPLDQYSVLVALVQVSPSIGSSKP